MSNIEALKEQARQHEQKEEWQKACDHYLRAIDELDDEEQPDIGLYNRVGDLLIRIGNYEQALEHFDRAADLYLEADLPNNAIAICKKVMRHLPNRTETYLRMGKIRADQGFMVDARESYLTYVEKVQAAGDMEEALRALGEFAELAPEDTEIRMAVAEQLIQHEREEEALEQLAAGYAVLKQRDDEDGAAAFEEKILELDPSADLETMAQASPAGTESFDDGFGFETTALDDAFEDEVTADFGEIVLGGAAPEEAEPGVEAAAGGEGEAGAPAGEGAGLEEDAFAEVTLGAGDAGDAGAGHEDEEEELAVGDFQEISLGDDDGAGDEGEEVDAEGEVDLPFIAMEDEDEEDDAGELPLLSDFVEEAVEGQEEEDEEEAAPLPFLTDEPEAEPEAELEPEPEVETGAPAGEELLAEAPDGEEVSDILAEAMEEAALEEPAPAEAAREEVEAVVEQAPEEDLPAAEEALPAPEEDPREAWQALHTRIREGEPGTDAAQRLVELAFRLDDQDALIQSYLHLADALVADDDETRAQGVYQQVLSLDPDNERARAALEEETAAPSEPVQEVQAADDYVDLGSLIFDEEEEKTTRFRVAYQEPSGDEEADFAKMLSQFKAKVAENFDVSDVKAHHDLGTAYKEMGLLDEAVEKFQEALRASPVHLPTYELLGQTFIEKGEPIAAVRVLERALKVPHQIEDELIGIYYFLGRAQEEVGNTEAAIEFYDRVFALDINFGDVTDRLRKLR